MSAGGWVPGLHIIGVPFAKGGRVHGGVTVMLPTLSLKTPNILSPQKPKISEDTTALVPV
jgi:hypothetical protein